MYVGRASTCAITLYVFSMWLNDGNILWSIHTVLCSWLTWFLYEWINYSVALSLVSALMWQFASNILIGNETCCFQEVLLNCNICSRTCNLRINPETPSRSFCRTCLEQNRCFICCFMWILSRTQVGDFPPNLTSLYGLDLASSDTRMWLCCSGRWGVSLRGVTELSKI